MIFAINESKILKCLDWKDLVRKLYERTFDEVDNKNEYMLLVQQRIKSLYAEYIPTKKYKQFCLALNKIGILTLMKCRMCDNYRNYLGLHLCDLGKIAKPNNMCCSFFINGDVSERGKK
jgi:hypothetical protein